MSEISDMIQRLCPDGVEYRKLGEVVKIMNGKDYKSHQEGNIPVYGTGGILTYIDTAFDDGPTVLLPRKGSIDKVYYVDSPFWTVDTIYWTKFSRDSLVCPKFLYYFMTTINLSKMNTGTGAIPSLTQTVLSRIEIPVPPLEVQRKIVEVLDNFSELTAELTAKLTAELEARKKQYEYYRDNLLNFSQIAPPNSVKWMKLGEICNIFTGGEVPMNTAKGQLEPSMQYPYPVYANGKDVYGYTDSYQIDCDAVCVSSIGANTGDVFYRNAYFTPAIRLKVIVPKIDYLNTKFLFYITSVIDFSSKNKGSVPNINAEFVKRILIPIPPLSEQERIVSILDRFEALTTDLTSGLPAEIKARQQQYEYYRDQLLTFKRAN